METISQNGDTLDDSQTRLLPRSGRVGAKYGLMTGWVIAVIVNLMIGVALAVWNALDQFDTDGPLQVFGFFVVAGLTVGGILGAIIGFVLGFAFGATGTIKYAKTVMVTICTAPALYRLVSVSLDAIDLYGIPYATMQDGVLVERTKSLVDVLPWLGTEALFVVAVFVVSRFSGSLFIESTRRCSFREGWAASFYWLADSDPANDAGADASDGR